MESLTNNPGSNSKTSFLSPGLLAVIFIFIMVFFMGLIKIYSPDLGFHLRSAKWILDNKQFIYTDSFSYGSAEHKYFDLQWLYQLLVYSLYKRSETLLVIVNALLITCSLVLVWIRFLRISDVGFSNIKLSLFALIAGLFVQPLTFEIRPFVLSWVFLNLTLICLDTYKKTLNKRVLYALPIISLFWINTHSLAILGLVTIGIYNAGIYFEKGKVDKTLLLYSTVSFAFLFLNPYFIDGFIYPLSQFGIISGDSLFKSYLGELRSPFTAEEISMLGSRYFTSPLMIIHLSAIYSLFSIFHAIKLKHYTDSLLMAAYLVLLYMAHRNYGLFFMVSLPLFVKYTLNWIENRKKNKPVQKAILADKKRLSMKEDQKPVLSEPGYYKLFLRLSFISILFSLFIIITSMTDSYALFRHSPYRFGFTNDKDQLPVEATDFLNKNRLKGKLLNHLDFGGYLMAHFDEKVFIDGRMDLFEEAFFKKYYESLTNRNGIRNLLNEYDPDIVIFPYLKASLWWEYFVAKKEKSGYKAVHFDGLSVIYVKSSAFPQIPELTEIAIMQKVDPIVVARIGNCLETAKPGRSVALIKGLWQKQSFSIADQNKASYCFTNGFDSAGLYYSVKGIERSTIKTPNIFKNLSIFYQGKKMPIEAQLCEDKAE